MSKAFLTGVVAALAMAGSAVADCCADLVAALPSHVYAPDTSDYTTLNNHRWSGTEILSPSCIFTPLSAANISTALPLLVAGGCKFAIKSGGHNANPGWNNIDDGVSIDLSLLNAVSLSADASVASVGAGSTWIDAYRQLEPLGVGITGGLCGTTGVGGVTLGGGQSIFSASRGWVVDSVVNFELVLANGTVTSANQTAHPDLFRALKGGGNNFGVVTRVDLATFALAEDAVYGGQVVVPATDALVADALAMTLAYVAMNNALPANALQTVFFYFSTGEQMVNFAFANVGGLAGAANATFDIAELGPLAAVLDLLPQVANTVAQRSLVSLVEEVIPTQPDGYRDLWATVTFKVDPSNDATMLAVHDATNAIFERANASVADLDWIFFYQPWPRSVSTFGSATGGNVLGQDDLDYDQIMIFITPRWLDPLYDETMYALARDWTAAVQNATTTLGTAVDFLYANFADKDQKPLCSYGADNVAFLQDVAASYDPDGVFQTLVPGGFKVSAAC